MRFLLVATVPLALLNAAAAQFGVDCQSQSGLINIAALGSSNCGNSFGGLNGAVQCQSQTGGLVNVGLLGTANCGNTFGRRAFFPSLLGGGGGPLSLLQSSGCQNQNNGLINLGLANNANCYNSY